MGSAASNVAQGFFLTSPGVTPALAFSGQLQCEVQVNAPGTLASTPQYSTDGVTWVPATVIGNGSIVIPGTYIGTNPAAAGYTFLRLNVSSFTGPQLSGQLACGDSLPPANSGGTGAVSSVNGGTCIQATPSSGAVVVSYSCPTPNPATVTETTCTTSTSTSCTSAVSVAAGVTQCAVAINATDTTVSLANVLAPAVSTPLTNSVTVTAQTATSSTGTLATNVLCF